MKTIIRFAPGAFALVVLAACSTPVPVSTPGSNAAAPTVITATKESRPAETRSTEPSPKAPSQSTSSSQASGTLYVAPNGDDKWSGLLASPNTNKTDGPFATFERARAQVQTTIKSGAKPVTVQFRDGTYFLPATIQLTSADSGTANAPIMYENYPGESPVFSGGARVQNWTNAGGNLWKTTLPASTQYFENLFYNGVRRLRPRVGGYLGTYLRFVGPVYLNAPAPPASAPELSCSIYIAGKGWECFDRFQYDPADPLSNTWRNLAPPVGNPCSQPAGSAALVGDIELIDFEQYDAAKLRISCVDPLKHIVYLTGATLARERVPSSAGFTPRRRYLVENVQDALGQPAQWFLDRSTTPWTLSYLANPGENPNNDPVIIPQLAQLLVASDLEYVTFKGMAFEYANPTIPAEGDGNPQYQMSAAVSFQNSQHIIVDSSIVAHVSGVGLEFITCINAQPPAWCVSRNNNAVNSNNRVENSAIYDVGSMGIRIGWQGHPGDTDGNVPQFTTLENNVVAGYGREFPGAPGVLQGNGHDNLVTHNDVYDGYHGAIHVCDCSGTGIPPLTNNNVVSFNHVYNLFQGILNDAGSIYFQVANVGEPQVSGTGNKILNNKVHDVSDASALDEDGYGGDGLYVDDWAGSVDIENNLVYRVSGSAMSFSGPRAGPNNATTIKNNIFAFARLSMINAYNPYSFGNSPPAPLFSIATNNLFYFDRNTASSPPFHVQGGCTYGGQSTYTAFEQWNSNLYWRTDGGFANDAQAYHIQSKPAANAPCAFNNAALLNFFPLADWQKIGEDAKSIVENPGFANPAYPADDYSLPKGSPGVGFVPFDLTQPGRTNPIVKPPLIPATFPTRLFNSGTDF